MIRLLACLLSNEGGATAIEYALIASMFVIAIIVSLQSLGGETDGMWGNVSTSIVEATEAVPS